MIHWACIFISLVWRSIPESFADVTLTSLADNKEKLILFAEIIFKDLIWAFFQTFTIAASLLLLLLEYHTGIYEISEVLIVTSNGKRLYILTVWHK